MSNKNKFHFGVSVNSMDPITKKVYEGLLAGESKKVLSNKYKMDITTINAISKRFRTGLDKEITPAISEYIAEQEKELECDMSEIDESNTDTKTTRKAYKRLSEEDRKMVVELIKDGYSNEELAKSFEVSKSTISRIRCENGLNLRHKKSITVTEAEESVSEKSLSSVEDKLIRVNSSVRTGLVAGRHQMPVDKYIFNKAFTNDEMFDYDRLDKICRNFIRHYIEFDENGNAKQTLILYTTGIQCALASIIKMTNLMKVNLIIRHYKHDTKTYQIQPIWTEFGNTTDNEEFLQFFGSSSDTFTYNTTLDEIKSNKKVIRVSRVICKSSTESQINLIFCNTENDAYNIASYFISKAKKEDRKEICYVKTYKYDEANKKFCITSDFEMKLQSK